MRVVFQSYFGIFEFTLFQTFGSISARSIIDRLCFVRVTVGTT